MLASFQWLRELSGLDLSASEMAERLTSTGLEVESLVEKGAGLDHVVIGEIRSKKKHPDKDRLSIVTVFDGTEEQEVICGAPNVPEAGGLVLFAQLGAQVGDITIAERKIAGIVSRGMICSETELDIGAGGEGIFVVESRDFTVTPKVGQSVREALALGDTIFEIGVTPNRPDALGHVGIARDLTALAGQAFKAPVQAAPKRLTAASPTDSPTRELFSGGASGETAANPVSVTISAPDRGPRYGAGRVTGVLVGPSPFWLRYRLHTLGVRPRNNVVDATNLALFEWGHPTHAFDLEKVGGNRIDVRLAKDGEELTTLDDVKRTLTADDLLICDGDGPVAIAGVMGGGNSEISDSTTEVLIECAYFDPRSVRRTSRRTGLHTDASHRFERGVDPEAVWPVLRRVTQLIADLSGGTAFSSGLDVYPTPLPKARISLRVKRISQVLGFETPAERVVEILEHLGCEVAAGDTLVVKAPTHRPDLLREEDLIEEVARIEGYDRIPALVPRVSPSERGTPVYLRTRRAAREYLASAGLHEAVNYAFVSGEELKNALVDTNSVPLKNPLSQERSVLRTSLLPGLLAAAQTARRRQVEDVCLFEVGRSFHPSTDASTGVLPSETEWVSFLLSGSRPGWIGPGEQVDFFDGKGVASFLLARLGLRDIEYRAPDNAAGCFHPKRVANVLRNGEAIGSLGTLHPDVRDAYDLGAAVYCELRLEALLPDGDAPQARPLPRFPTVSRDIAVIVDRTHSASSIEETLKAASGALFDSVGLFDLYEGEQIPASQRSLAFRIVYRHPDRTLTEKDIDPLYQAALAGVKETHGATVR